MGRDELEMKREQAHFKQCRTVIEENILRYERDYEERRRRALDLHKAVSGGGDNELYSQLMTAVSLEEQAETGLKKNKAALDKPYFGRIDYEDADRERKESIYIGKNGVFRSRTEVLIVDWRAPAASIYYENELGPGEYSLPDETKIPVRLDLKRTYDVNDGKLLGFYDSDVASNDELLVKYLSRNKDAVLGEIIATIQKEQNAIIRESPFANLIVQGVAGSGKTTVAMHRISYLLYNYKERFESNEFCIVGGSDLLLNYITSGLPELDVYNIRQLRMDLLFTRLCEKDWTKRFCTVTPDITARERCTLSFMLELELFLMQKREALVDCRELRDPEIGVILSESGSLTLLRENPSYSICRLLGLLDERVKTRIRFLMSGGDRDEIQDKLRQYAGYYKAKKPKETPHDFYLEFLAQRGKNAAGHGFPAAARTAGCSGVRSSFPLTQDFPAAAQTAAPRRTKAAVSQAWPAATARMANHRQVKAGASPHSPVPPAQTADRSNDNVQAAAEISTVTAAHTADRRQADTEASEASCNPQTEYAAHLERLRRQQYDLYDTAALALIHYRVTQQKPNEEFSLLFLDEAQDFGMSVYYVLRTLLPDAYFTVMGDVSQNIHYDTGLNDWYELTRLLLTGPKDKFLLLQKSYRNTIEISEYAGKLLDRASSGRYKITPVIRHGLPVQEERFQDLEQMARRTAALIPEIRERGYPTTAVICMDDRDTALAAELLSGRTSLAEGGGEHFTAGTMVLPVHLVKGLEFDTVILWNPDVEKGLKSPGSAKLLYVAATRALHELYVFTGPDPTEPSFSSGPACKTQM